MRRALVFAAVLSLTRVASAQSAADPGAKATARQLAADGIRLYNAGDYAGALKKFDVASSLVPATTLGLRAARCLEKLGRLVEASERYVEVTRMKLDPNANPTLRRAQQDAADERAKLLPRIPTLTIQIEGPRGPEELAVLLDDRPMAPALVGQRQPIDPGTHRVRVRRADTEVAAAVTLQEGGAENVVLKLPPLAERPLPPPPPPLPTSESSSQRTLGWVAIGGGAGLIALGGVHGVVGIGMQSSLLAQCPNRVCPPSAQGQSSLYDAVRVISSVGLIAGALGVAAGVPLVLTSPKPAPGSPPSTGGAPRARVVTVSVAPASGGAACVVRGAF